MTTSIFPPPKYCRCNECGHVGVPTWQDCGPDEYEDICAQCGCTDLVVESEAIANLADGFREDGHDDATALRLAWAQWEMETGE